MDSCSRHVALAICAAVSLALLPLAFPMSAFAQTDAGRIHFQAGASDYESGDYQHALEEFQRAYELSQRPQLFYNIALAYQQLGDLEHAVEYLGRFLNEVEDIANRENLERRLTNFQERLAAEQASTHDTATDTNADANGNTNTNANTNADTNTNTNANANTNTNMDADADADANTNMDAHADANTDTNADTDANLDTHSELAASSGGSHVPAIASFVGGGVGLVMAVSFGVVALSQQGDCDSRQGTPNACTSSDGSTMDTMALLSDVGTGLAVVGVGLGLVFLLAAKGDDHPDRARLRIAPFASPSAAGLAAQGRF